MNSDKIREASHAGSWYIGDTTTLNKQIEDYLGKAKNASTLKVEKNIKAIIGPHAGFDYSGPTAAYAYYKFQAQEKLRVFLLGPCHHTYIKGIGLSNMDQYETPLGNIELDKETIQQIATDLKKGFIFTTKDVEEQEHSLEMHLPFIYKTFPKCKLVPIMVGATNPELEQQIAQNLVKYFEDPSTVFVISSDFCHWGKRFQYTPYNQADGQIYQSIEKLDQTAIDLIKAHSLNEYYNYLDQTENTICGRHPIGVLLNILKLTKLKVKTELAKYAQSSQVTRMNDSSVSYASLVTYISE